MRNAVIATVLSATAVTFGPSVSSATTLDQVKENGFVQCGVHQGLQGFSIRDDNGRWTGLDVDLCRAIAAAIFADPEAARFTPLSAADRFETLQSRDIDVLTRNTTWTMNRDTQLGLNFAAINYYDGQGFMIRTDMNINSALELSGATICTEAGTTAALNVADYFGTNNMEYQIFEFEQADEAVAAYDGRRCQVYTNDQSALYAQRLTLSDPEAHRILPEIISKEPLGPVVRQDDDQWFNLVKWVHFAMVNAEELGVNSQNVDQLLESGDPAVRRLLGVDGDLGAGIGLDADWAYKIVKHVGNYGEVFDRNVGPDTDLAIARGINALWTKGGLQYAPPVR